jgi:hypothetical protein
VTALAQPLLADEPSFMSATPSSPHRTVLLRDDVRAGSRIERALNRLRLVFLQLPGAQLSVRDVVQLTELDAFLSQILLNALEDVRFVYRRQDGLYQHLPAD